MITAKQLDVFEVLGDKFLPSVPNYQKPYAGTPIKALQLFDDVQQAAVPRDAEPYFLGSLVLIKREEEIEAHVVDGQQRLTTLTILCAVLRDVATDPREKAALADTVYVEPDPYKGRT